MIILAGAVLAGLIVAAVAMPLLCLPVMVQAHRATHRARQHPRGIHMHPQVRR